MGRPRVRSAMKKAGNYMAVSETSRMLRVVASVPPVTFPKTPKPLPLCFHRAHLSLRYQKTKHENYECNNINRSRSASETHHHQLAAVFNGLVACA
jgi:hypothetical protein